MSAFALTSCIEETFPEDNVATAGQIAASPSALEASLRGIPSQMAQGYLVYGSQTHETDMAYPAYMIAQTELLGDMYPGVSDNTGYDWYKAYNVLSYNMADNSYPSYLSWFTFYKFIKSANDIISAVGDVNAEGLTDYAKGASGVAHACRAFNYYMLTVLFEPKENIYTDCSEVAGLTVPFVTETTTNDIAKNNPRATHEEMIAFILNDLTIAEQCLQNYEPEDKTVPNLAVVYGIRAKVHMWDEDYANAAKYARLAIEASGATPLTDAQWNDLNAGFNTKNQAWMWYLHYDAENMGNLCNFTGWMSPEADWGYASLTQPVIDKSLYEKYGENDFRRKTIVDPDRANNPRETVRGQEWLAEMPDYLNMKFRCLGGDFETYSIGGAVDVPVMRVEEMYLIEAEAVGASQSVAEGVALLNNFMNSYRDPEYISMANDLRTLQLDVLTQMRLEFWGEGCAFPAAKRLEVGVMQNYEGTNAPDDDYKINCKGIKPNWNMVIPNSEVQANVALMTTNNPNPTNAIKGPSPVGEYHEGNGYGEDASTDEGTDEGTEEGTEGSEEGTEE